MEKSYSEGFRFKKSDLGKFSTNETDFIVEKLKNNERIIGLTNGKFSLIDLIYSILKYINGGNIIIVTWSAGIKDINQIKWMLNTNLIKSVLLITDRSFVNRKAKYAIDIEDLFGKENIRTGQIHAKFVLVQNEKYKITIRTSMNLNKNNTCEHFEIENDETVFDFFNNFVKHQFDYNIEGFVADTYTANENLKRYFEDDKKEIEKKWFEL